MYRVAVEWLLGFRVQGANLALSPCIPHGWSGFEITYQYGTARYDIAVENPLGVCGGVLAIKLDGKKLMSSETMLIPLVDDGATHKVQLVLG